MRFLLSLLLCCLAGITSHAANLPDTIPLRLAHGLLVIPVQIGGQEHRFILDTGMTRFAPSLWGGRVADAATGSHAVALGGAAPQDSLWRVEFPQWRLGNTAFTGVSSVAGGQAPISSIGAPLSRYGQIILDYGKEKFYFIPYEQGPVPVKPVRDFQVQYADGRLFVGLVWPRSHAYAQGVRPGMRVTEADGQPLDDDFCRLIRLLDRQGRCTLTLEGEGKSIRMDYDAD